MKPPEWKEAWLNLSSPKEPCLWVQCAPHRFTRRCHPLPSVLFFWKQSGLFKYLAGCLSSRKPLDDIYQARMRDSAQLPDDWKGREILKTLKREAQKEFSIFFFKLAIQIGKKTLWDQLEHGAEKSIKIRQRVLLWEPTLRQTLSSSITNPPHFKRIPKRRNTCTHTPRDCLISNESEGQSC